MRFYYILLRNNIGPLLRTSWDYFAPPPSHISVFYRYVQLNVAWRDAVQSAVFATPPPFTPRNDRCNLSFCFL